MAELFYPTIQYLVAYKPQTHTVGERHSQMKETHEQMEQELLLEKTSHDRTRLQLENTRSELETTQGYLEGRVDLLRT